MTYDYIVIGSGFGGSVPAFVSLKKVIKSFCWNRENDLIRKIFPKQTGTFQNTCGFRL
jgi:hypothetical protein